MHSDLMYLANNLYKIGLTREPLILEKLMEKLGISDTIVEYDVSSQKQMLPKGYDDSFQWPWDAWNSLPQSTRDDFYEIVDTLSWIPILGTGALSAKFVWLLFEGKHQEAAVTLVFILLSFYMAVKLTPKISLLKSTGSIATDSLKEISKNMTTKSIVIDAVVNELQNLLDVIIKAFASKDPYFLNFSANLKSNKSHIKKYVEQEITKYLV
jgi:hypothetical protein